MSDAAPLVVIEGLQSAGATSTGAGQIAEPDFVYIGLAPGTSPAAAYARIYNTSNHDTISVFVVDGGFDPVTVAGREGDIIVTQILSAGGSLLSSVANAVPVRRVPRIVRTVPHRRRPDMPINQSIIVVFSEPIDSVSMVPTAVQLYRGTRRVAGTLRYLTGHGSVLVFTPDAPLTPNAGHRFVIEQGVVRDVQGDQLESGLTYSFTTGTGTTGAPASLAMSTDTVRMSVATYWLTATVTDAAGNMLVFQPVSWSSSDPDGLQVTQSGLITATASGNYTVTASLGGLAATTEVTVRGAPATIEIDPSPATVPADEAIIVSASVLDLGGFSVDAPVSWSSADPGIATVTGSGNVATVTGVTEGSVLITATSGDVSRSVSVQVTPRRVIASVATNLQTFALLIGDEVEATAQPLDAIGVPIPGRSLVWTSENPSVADVGQTGRIAAVGNGTTRILATSEGVTGSITVTVKHLDVAAISAATQHACALTTTGETYCWGREATPLPTRVLGAPPFVSITSGNGRSCGLTADDEAWCWISADPTGYGGAGPAPGDLRFTSIVTGGPAFCALATDGNAYCWGSNPNGVLGTGTLESSDVPVRVAGGHMFVSLAAGKSDHVCALIADGSAYCWGRNQFGQLGTGSTVYENVPVQVSGGLKFVALAAGFHHTCGLVADGRVFCWGIARQLGNADGASSLVPRLVEDAPPFVAITAGSSHTCALTAEGAAWCWGQNEEGRLGNGTVGQSLLPSRVVGGITFATLSGGGAFTCGRSTAGIAWCWGGNTDNELGDGSSTNSLVPIKVARQP